MAGAANVVDSIFLALGLQTEDVERGLQNMEGKARQVMARIARDVVAPVMSFAALTKAINKYVDQSFELGKLAKATDVSIERLQAWKGAAADAGVEAGTFENSIYGVQKSMASAAVAGRSDFTDMLTRLSIGWMQATGEVRNAEDVILDVSDRLSKLSNTQAIHVGSSLGFDKDAIQFLRVGRGELEKMLEAQKEFGMLTAEDAQAAALQRKELGRLGRSWDMLTGKLVRQFLPAVTFVVQGVTKITTFLQKHEALLSGVLLGLMVVMGAKFVPMIITMIGWLKKLGLAFLFNPATSVVTAIVAGIALISLALDDLMTYAKGGESSDLLKPLWESFGTPAEVAKGLAEAMKTLKNILTGVAPAAAWLLKIFVGWLSIFVGLKIIMGVVAICSKLGAAIAFLISVGAKFGTVLMFLAKALGVVLTVLRAISVALLANPIGAVIAAIAAAALLVITYWDDLKEYFSAFFGWLGKIWDATLGGIVDGVKWVTDAAKKFFSWLSGDEEKKMVVKQETQEKRNIDEDISRPKDDPAMLARQRLMERERAARGEKVESPMAPAPQSNAPSPVEKGRPGYPQEKPYADAPKNPRPQPSAPLGKLDPEAWPPQVVNMAYELAQTVNMEQASVKAGATSPLTPPAAVALPPSVTNNAGNTTITQEVTIDKIDVVTRATDAQGTAAGLRQGLTNELSRNLVIPSARGVNNK